MNPELKKIIEERANKLPAKVMAAIKSVLWVEKMIQIAKNNNLSEEKETLFITETTLLVFGIESPTKYPGNLGERVGLDDGTVIKIAKEVNEQIIMPITKMVEENNSEQKKETVPEKKPEPIAPTSAPPASASDSAKAMPNKQGSGMAMEIPPANLPMVEKGEIAHSVPHVEQAKAQHVQPARQDPVSVKPEPKVNVPLPDYRYPEGRDPYREPLV